MAAAHPFDWHLHVFWLLALLGLVAAYLWATRQPGWGATTRQRLLFFGGVARARGRPDVAPRRPGRPLAAHGAGAPAVVAHPGRAPAPRARNATPGHRPPDPACSRRRRAARGGPAGAGHRDRHRGGSGHADRRGGRASPRTPRSPGSLIELVVLASGFVLWAPVLTELPGAPRLSALGPRRLSHRAVDRAELPLHRLDLRPASSVSQPSPTPAPWRACRRCSTRSWPASWPS